MSTMPLSSILTRLSYELHALAEATDEFHHLAFGDNGPRSGGLDDEAFVRAAQSIDHTQQILANLSEFAACLAMGAPIDMELDARQALSLLTLSDLRTRLSDTPGSSMPVMAMERQEAGEPELFF